MTPIERFAIGLMVGIFGLLIGLFAWWTLSNVPGLEFGWMFYLILSCGLGILSFVLGLWQPKKTIDVLGLIGQTILRLSNEVLRWFRFLR